MLSRIHLGFSLALYKTPPPPPSSFNSLGPPPSLLFHSPICSALLYSPKVNTVSRVSMLSVEKVSVRNEKGRRVLLYLLQLLTSHSAVRMQKKLNAECRSYHEITNGWSYFWNMCRDEEKNGWTCVSAKSGREEGVLNIIFFYV